jgi:c-di-GMP-binding flagellar brake protein YcgR
VGPAGLRFLERVAEAYRASPLEILAIVFSLLVLLGGLVVYTAMRGRRQRKHSADLSKQLYDQKSKELRLTTEHHELLALMTKYLRDPTRVHQLLTDEVAFNAAAAHLRENHEATPQDVASLRLALGYRSIRTDRSLKSSAQIPEGATVLVARNRYKKPFKAKVRAPEAERFLITLVDDGSRAPVGAAVDIYFQNSAGVFTFRTSVMEEKGRDISLLHSEEIKRYQKRRYYRRKIDLPVHVYPFDLDRPLLSRFKDIGGGGASLLNTNRHFKVGDDLELRFTPNDEEIRITGTVMRLSEGDAVMHVNYEHIRDGLRDRIYSAIFRPPKDEEDAMEQGEAQARAGEPAAGQPRPASGSQVAGSRPSVPPGPQGTNTTP